MDIRKADSGTAARPINNNKTGNTPRTPDLRKCYTTKMVTYIVYSQPRKQDPAMCRKYPGHVNILQM